MGDLRESHGPGSSEYLYGCECDLCGPWETYKPEPKPPGELRVIGLVEYTEINLHQVKEPFWLNVNLHDIPNTMAAAIRVLPKNCRKVNVVRAHADSKLVPVVEAAAEKGIEINWVSEYLNGVIDHDPPHYNEW